MKTTAPYGTWSSSVTGNFVAEQSLRVNAPMLIDDKILWLESRPAEQGRQVIVMRTNNGKTEDILPPPWSARSKVHEYGGGAYTIANDTLYFVNAADQQIYRMDLTARKPTAITNTQDCRYADLSISPDKNQLIAVCEQHTAGSQEPENRLIRIDLMGQSLPICDNTPLKFGGKHDFFSNPRFSPCGKWLSYITWDHPNMPWDNTQLWLLPAQEGSAPKLIAGNGQESIVQSKWSEHGDLFWVSDKDNWWNIYTLEKQYLDASPNGDQSQCIYSSDAEFATPPWVFGMSSYCFIDANTLFATYTQGGSWHAIQLEKMNGAWISTPIESDLVHLSELFGSKQKAIFCGASTTSPTDLYIFENGKITPLPTQIPPSIKDDDKSIGRSFEFPTGNGNESAHGTFYPPQSSRFEAPKDSKPPLIVFGHGGPTGASDRLFNYKIQFWTQRGFAVVEVNYRGSTGYGRRFRHSLQKQWGVYDVEDLAAAAEHLTQQGWVHPQQRVVRGSSAGGFTVLAALTDTSTFNAGCTLYGIGDLEALATDTHKFEARYLDGLIGPYPEEKALYIQRSPIHKIANISCPVLVFQGAEDKVVPPEQAEIVVQAVKEQNLPIAYVLYENEGHGFRRAENIQHQAEAELYFYQQVLGLTQSTPKTPPITIENWSS